MIETMETINKRDEIMEKIKPNEHVISTHRFEHIKGRHPVTMMIIDMLKQLSIGSELNYSEIYAVTGSDVSAGATGYRYLQSAKEYCIRNHGMVISPVRGENKIVRLNDNEIINCMSNGIDSIRRKAKRYIRKASVINTVNLSDEAKRSYFSKSAMLGAIKVFSSKKAEKAICDNTKLQEIDFTETIKIFNK
jgi:hypothetical protein